MINWDSSHHDDDKPSAVNQNKGGGKRPRKEGSQRWIRNQLRAKIHDLSKQALLQNSVALTASDAAQTAIAVQHVEQQKATAAKEHAEAATAAAALAVKGHFEV